LVAAAADGETICILRRGKPFARLVAAAGKGRPIEPATLRTITEAMPVQPENASAFVRRMRDDERY
jgi:antitoxin (DNA-binding transcriptional repressor) of toxin-antitoxin stability system